MPTNVTIVRINLLSNETMYKFSKLQLGVKLF